MLLVRRTPFLLLVMSILVCASTRNAPEHKEAARLNNVGVALMNQHNMEKAVEKFNQALRKAPTLFIVTTNKAIALLNIPSLPEAEEVLSKAVAERPNDPRVWYLRGLLHEKLAQNEKSVDDFKTVLKFDPSDADSHFLLASAYSKLQQYDKAVPEFQTALRLDPHYASAEFGLARTLQRLGRKDEAREHLHRFEYLTRNKIAVPLSLNYGEQGRYALPQDAVTGEPAVGPMIPVRFVQQPLAPQAKGRSQAAVDGGALCLVDVNGDGKEDLLVTAGGNGFVQLFVADGKGGFIPAEPRQFGISLTEPAVSCAVGDYDNDGRPDLAIATRKSVVLFRNVAKGKFADVTAATGIVSRNNPSGLTFVDYDHDGDLDLYVVGSALAAGGSGANVLWRNNGNGNFADVTAETGLAGTSQGNSVVLSDINNDRAVDLIVTGTAGAPTLFSNQREGKFRVSRLSESTLPSTGIAILDFNKDGWMDVVVTHDGPPGVSLWKNVGGKSFERVPLPISDAKKGWGVTPIDIDNDGWMDLAVVIETSSRSEVRLLRNVGQNGFADLTKSVGLDRLRLADARAIVAADVDGDGDADLLVTGLRAAPIVLRNEGGNRNRSLRISLEGLADNKSAIGTKVEVFAGGLWQKFEVPGGSGYRSQGSNQLEVGLGSNDRADVVRMLWPTGVLQDEIDVPLEKVASFVETDRRGSSCPTLFTWNGREYEFISDVIGAAVIGHWISPTERNVADPDEWVKIDGSQLAPYKGFLSVRFGEPMEEVNYIDQLRLVAVDHPANREVYPDERFVSAPPFPSGAPILTSQPRLPAGAWDDSGDVLNLLRAKDHQYVRGFTNLKFAGYANSHALTLDLGDWSPQNPLRMLMHGFIEYFTATSMYAAWQAGIQPVAPYVEAEMPDGKWVRVLDDMGFPAGLPRTIVVDLTGKLPAGTRKIRIVTNLQIYWDQILIDNGPSSSNELRQTELPLTRASLAARGYPQQVDGNTPGDLTYIYDRASKTGPFAAQTGNYTSYGEVTPLLQAVDDRYVIFGTGEDIDAEFSTASLPPLPEGWKRDYFFYANGFVKDMDFYEATPFTVAEMPFAGMSSYPYTKREHYPDDAGALNYRLEWNDRYRSVDQAPGYRFRYLPRSARPEIGKDDSSPSR